MTRSATRPARNGRASGDRTNLYDEITDRIIAELEAGRLPWVQPWGTSAVAAPLALPKNAASGRRYSGINVLILWGAVVERGHAGQSWLTFRQALALGRTVRKGERGTTVVYADRFVPGEERQRAQETGVDARAIHFLKRFTVFNVEQCDGLPPELAAAAPPADTSLIEPRVQALIATSGADLRIGGERAYYDVLGDFIRVPPPQAYFQPIDWHRTALHELGHDAACRIMPRGLPGWRGCGASATRRGGIIRALPGMRAARRRGGIGPGWHRVLPRAPAPVPSAAGRRGCRPWWSRPPRGRARGR